MNTPEGCLTVGNGSQSYANTALLPAVAVPAMLAAIAIPNFVKGPRQPRSDNACINNLRQIDAAKNQWALEKGKKARRRADQGRSSALSEPLAGLSERRHLHHWGGGRTADVQHPRPCAAVRRKLHG